MKINLTIVKILDCEMETNDEAQKLSEIFCDEIDSFEATGVEVNLCIYDLYCSMLTKQFYDEVKERLEIDVEYRAMKGESCYKCYSEYMRDMDDIGWINFSRVSSSLNIGKLLETIEKGINNNTKVVTLNPIQETLGKQQKCLFFKERNFVVELEKDDMFCHNFILDSFAFRKDCLRGIEKKIYPEFEPEELLIIETLSNEKKYYLSETICIIRRNTLLDLYNNGSMYRKEWYTATVNKCYIPLIKKENCSVVVQTAILCLLEIKFNSNKNIRNKNILNNDELNEFFSCVGRALRLIDDELIARYKYSKARIMPKYMSLFFLKLKYGNKSCERKLLDEEVVLLCDNKEITIENTRNIHFAIDAINWENGNLIIDCELLNIYWADYDKIVCKALIGDKTIEAKRTDVFCHAKYFGKTVWKGYMCQFVIPVEYFQSGTVGFSIDVDDAEFDCRKILFRKLQSRLNHKYNNSYWIFEKWILTHGRISDIDVLQISPNTLISHFLHECRYIIEIKNRKIALLRFKYYLEKRKKGHKPVWITYDQLYKGGDNGEYFFRYVENEHGGEQELYYIANDNSDVCTQLKKTYGNVLQYNLEDRKKNDAVLLKSLIADVIFATRADVGKYCGFGNENSKYSNCLRDLFNARITCLQHGLTIQKIAEYQNLLFDNTRHYFCASPYEIDNIKKKEFGYCDSMISLTGSPRYDGLVGDPSRQILISPTWRRNVLEGISEKGQQGNYSKNFRTTDYYHVFNALVNDEKLLACAKDKGYKIIFLLHPNMGPQIGDFEKNGQVEIISGADVNYEIMMKKSDLMVTDYSGIQFDFAYMRRPLVYYHPEKVPPQYEVGGLEYDSMGFGPVCTKHHEIIDAICDMMKNNCELQDIYRERINNFFPFNDQNNCERVYEAAIHKLS